VKISRLDFSRRPDRNILFLARWYGGVRRISRMIVTIVHHGISVIRSRFTARYRCVIGRRANPIIVSYLGIFKSVRKICGTREIVVRFIRVGSVPHVKPKCMSLQVSGNGKREKDKKFEKFYLIKMIIDIT